MIRVNLVATVRSLPEHRTGTTNGRAWSFYSVGLLDSDYNKIEGTIDDELFAKVASVFGEGAKVDLVADVSASSGRLRCAVQQAKPVASAKAA